VFLFSHWVWYLPASSPDGTCPPLPLLRCLCVCLIRYAPRVDYFTGCVRTFLTPDEAAPPSYYLSSSFWELRVSTLYCLREGLPVAESSDHTLSDSYPPSDSFPFPIRPIHIIHIFFLYQYLFRGRLIFFLISSRWLR